jgi:hypothetical protein
LGGDCKKKEDQVPIYLPPTPPPQSPSSPLQASLPPLNRWKLAEKFASAEDAFAALDDDGGGELSRVELARGLRSVGVNRG